MISYYSTRDEAKQRVSFEHALLKGLAPDGGLFIPDSVPNMDAKAWLEAESLADLGVPVLSAWLGNEIPQADLEWRDLCSIFLLNAMRSALFW